MGTCFNCFTAICFLLIFILDPERSFRHAYNLDASEAAFVLVVQH